MTTQAITVVSGDGWQDELGVARDAKLTQVTLVIHDDVPQDELNIMQAVVLDALYEYAGRRQARANAFSAENEPELEARMRRKVSIARKLHASAFGLSVVKVS